VFERRIADLLGTPSALFFPTGAMAQQVALRVHAGGGAARPGRGRRPGTVFSALIAGCTFCGVATLADGQVLARRGRLRW
jgi:hypothetical protein